MNPYLFSGGEGREVAFMREYKRLIGTKKKNKSQAKEGTTSSGNIC